jgi:Family of unknown function (DUF5995)
MADEIALPQSVWGPAHQDICTLLDDRPADVPAVVAHLTELQISLDRVPPLLGSNPLADFNKLYRTITASVLDRLATNRFRDPRFLAELDVQFAARYFDALRFWTTAQAQCPRVWGVIFNRIAGPDVRALPSAVAGVNAHINFDLPFALVTTFDHLGCDPIDDGDQHHDYLQINDIFAAAIPGLRHGYLDRWQLLIDTMNGDLDDWWQGEMVDYTRNVAWRNSQKLWGVRHDMAALATERDRLDGNAAALGRLLLSPLGSFLQ